MSRGKLILASLKPAKRAYAEGKFDYIGGAGGQNLEDHSARAYAKAREQLAAQGSKSNQPDSRKALISLANMYQDEPMSKDEMLVFQGGEHMYLDEGVLRPTGHAALPRHSVQEEGARSMGKPGPDKQPGAGYWLRRHHVPHLVLPSGAQSGRTQAADPM